MGVYIEGLKMPKNVPLKIWLLPDGNARIQTNSGKLVHFKAVEVKAPHGRLIDADALEQNAQERMLICNKNDNQFQKPYEVMRAIALAPTIIPAEEG